MQSPAAPSLAEHCTNTADFYQTSCYRRPACKGCNLLQTQAWLSTALALQSLAEHCNSTASVSMWASSAALALQSLAEQCDITAVHPCGLAAEAWSTLADFVSYQGRTTCENGIAVVCPSLPQGMRSDTYCPQLCRMVSKPASS